MDDVANAAYVLTPGDGRSIGRLSSTAALSP